MDCCRMGQSSPHYKPVPSQCCNRNMVSRTALWWVGVVKSDFEGTDVGPRTMMDRTDCGGTPYRTTRLTPSFSSTSSSFLASSPSAVAPGCPVLIRARPPAARGETLCCPVVPTKGTAAAGCRLPVKNKAQNPHIFRHLR